MPGVNCVSEASLNLHAIVLLSKQGTKAALPLKVNYDVSFSLQRGHIEAETSLTYGPVLPPAASLPGWLIDLEFCLIQLKMLFISTPSLSCLMSVPISLYCISCIFQFSLILLVINQPRNFPFFCILSFFIPS